MKQLLAIFTLVLLPIVLPGQSISAYQMTDLDFPVLNDYFKEYTILTMDQEALLREDYDEGVISVDLEGYATQSLRLMPNDQMIQGLELNRTIKMYGGVTNTGRMATLFISPYYFTLNIELFNDNLLVEPLRNYVDDADDNTFIAFYLSDFIEQQEKTCLAKESAEKQEDLLHDSEKSVDECFIIDIAIASDQGMLTRYGTVAAVEDHNISVLNDVQTNYRHEFEDNVEFKILTQYVSNQANEISSSTNANTVLGDFMDWGQNGGFGTTAYDVATFWTTRDLDGSTIGIAYVGQICTGFRYNVCQDFGNSDDKRVLQAHELGHNFSANHDGSGTDFIMAPAINNSVKWSGPSITNISNHVASRTCLAHCGTEGNPLGGLVTRNGTTTCDGSSIQFKDFSELGATRSWQFPGSTSTTSTEQQPEVTYTTTGTYDVSVTSNNTAGQNSTTLQDFISIQSAPNTPCDPTGNPSGGGLTRFEISNLINRTDGSSVNGRYEDFRCDEIVQLEPSTDYDVIFGIGVNCGSGQGEDIRLYIDYNNDGSFGSGEQAFFFQGLCGNFITTITTPATIAANELFLIRVVVNDGGTNSCGTNLTTGQVEDYSGFFEDQTALPIQLLSFDVTREDEVVTLDWSTSLEIDNVGWDIERSLDGDRFERIATQEGKGQSTNTNYYSYKDNNAPSVVTYYRLKQIDFDGDFSYSPILSVPGRKIDFSYFPNPTTEQLTIQHDYTEGAFIWYDQLGQVLFEVPVESLTQEIEIPTHIPAGLINLVYAFNDQRELLGSVSIVR